MEVKRERKVCEAAEGKKKMNVSPTVGLPLDGEGGYTYWNACASLPLGCCRPWSIGCYGLCENIYNPNNFFFRGRRMKSER